MKRFRNMLVGFAIFLSVVILGLYAFAPHAPGTPKQVGDVAALESYLNRLVESGNPPGLSLVVVKDENIIYNNAFGYADGPGGVKAKTDTVYHWWSMTKIPTAIAIMQLQEQGKLDLERPVKEYLPWFDVTYPSGTSQSITVRHLLQHTSGLPDTIPAMIGWVHYDDTTLDQTEIDRKYLSDFNKLKFEPGEKAVYSNFNYMVLGAIIEAVSGQSYEAYITRNILEPLGMSQTGFVYTPSMSDHEAYGTLPVVHFYTPLLPTLLDTSTLIRQLEGKLLWLNRVYIDATPSTGLIGPSTDVARFMLAYLNRGSLDGNLLLQPESISMLTETPPSDGHGLGWAIGETNGTHYLEHAGGGPGFAAIMRLYPELRIGFAILSNGTDLDRGGLMDLLAKMEW
ncbi:MAG: beta-lactamase family protein [Anaerolineae bacterium]|nr:beta-lactamase family protein [Anaerolineae bacterium]